MQTYENPKYAAAARVLGRKRGATVVQLAAAIKKATGEETSERQARLVIDRLRYEKGAKVKNIDTGRFQLKRAATRH